ncbi:MAG: CinA family nicotinamide mononucleotide deamidase-related protein, partial [Clostridia bacterium]|nr:CinA family nicotinamide mononucleotide deamidase-related protein [Clostridia bacterium]
YLHEESLERMRERFAFMHKNMTPNNEKQAWMPEGAVVFPNNAGTAPGCAIEDPERNKIVIMLPGPPFELKAMFDGAVIPYLSRYTESVFVSRNVCIFGMGESEVESHLKELMQGASNPTVAPYCGAGEVRLRVTARGKDAAICEEMCDKLIEEIRKTPVGDYIYGIDTSLAQAVVESYARAGKTVATAESCTGGLIAGTLTSVSGASAVLGFGGVTYSEEAKIKLLGVLPETIEHYGVVSPNTAEEMARGIRALSGADVGVSVTGFAGPGGGTDEYPVGTVFMGISSARGERHVHLRLKGDRDRVRQLTVTNALSQLLRELGEPEKSENL